jgi:hypothetical protein
MPVYIIRAGNDGPVKITVSVLELAPPPLKMPKVRREKIAASMRKSWRDGRLRWTFNSQRTGTLPAD